MSDLTVDRPIGRAIATLLLGHGAGAGSRSPAITAMTTELTRAGLAVGRFDFAYMAARSAGVRRPPPRLEVLVGEYADALRTLLADVDGPVLIGGKSMGSRVAARLAAGALDPRVGGLVAWGFPFHPPGQPEKSRLGDLAGCRLPALVLQGTRDPFGSRGEVEAMALPAGVAVRWFEDGDHDLAPRKSSGFTRPQHVAAAAAAIAGFAQEVSYSAGSKS